jgi:hypothetical protein
MSATTSLQIQGTGLQDLRPAHGQELARQGRALPRRGPEFQELPVPGV